MTEELRYAAFKLQNSLLFVQTCFRLRDRMNVVSILHVNEPVLSVPYVD